MSSDCNQKSKLAKNKTYVCNPLTGNWIKIDGPTYKKLIDQGIHVPVYDHSGKMGIWCVEGQQGNRSYMEDTYRVAVGTKGSYKLYAVYDGHGGTNVSKLLRDNFHMYLFEALDQIDELKKTKKLTISLIEQISDNIAAVYEVYDKYMYDNRGKLGIGGDGSTAIVIIDILDHLFFVNLGDSRAILVKDDKVLFATKDHKPEDEKERIEAAGAYVLLVGDVPRVVGTLAVARAFGDFGNGLKTLDNKYKGFDAPVSVLPEITAIRKDGSGSSYILLASDGLWDVISSNKAATYLTGTNLGKICKNLVNDAIYKFGSDDNTTAMVVKL